MTKRPREGSLAIAAIVVAFAARRGDVVYTGDVDDLERNKVGHFPSARVLGVGDGLG